MLLLPLLALVAAWSPEYYGKEKQSENGNASLGPSGVCLRTMRQRGEKRRGNSLHVFKHTSPKSDPEQRPL
ncbi:hypothetical protein AV530_016217 [Patagioenas fasciata monilis]|uniref:Uncharacterized protein n=1 Tax=Patagioenas fasciata monilis TaxID=372326 RepID=A0A1V4JWV0_PATFA|nr:hypothetical protein AV530_016217 [Patagioenas fasciata monilis]